MKVQRCSYSFRSRNGNCHFQGNYPQVRGSAPQVTGNAPQVKGKAPQVKGKAPHVKATASPLDAVNRLLAQVWRPNEYTGGKGTEETSYRQHTDFTVTALNKQCLSLRFEVKEQLEGDVVKQRFEGFTVDMERAREVTPFRRAQYDELLARCPEESRPADAAHPCGFYVNSSGLVLLFGDTREVPVPWSAIADIIGRVPSLRRYVSRGREAPLGGTEVKSGGV